MAPGIFQRLFYKRPFFAQPFFIPAYFVFPIGFKNGGELPVGTGAESPWLALQRKHQAEGQAAVRFLSISPL